MKIGKNMKWVIAQPLIGGMGIGFENAFGTPPSAIISTGLNNDNQYINYMNETRKLNIPIINMEFDYETFKSEKDEDLYNKICKNIDVLAHVAICSGLSQMNSCSTGSKARGDADNDQNQNMYNLTKLGMRIKAKVVAFENAPQAYTKSGAKTIDKLREIASGFDYSTHLFKTDTLLHGIPQSRRRTFIMFYRDGNPSVFDFEHKNYTELTQYMNEIPESAHHFDEFIGTSTSGLDNLYEFILDYTGTKTFLEAMNKLDKVKNTWTSAQLCELIGFDKAIDYLKSRLEKENDESLEKTLKQVIHYKCKKENKKSYWDNTTILANRGKFTNAIVGKSLQSMINPGVERIYSIREFMHLMGMPHDFELAEPKKNYNFICQNVPVKTATFIGSQIKKCIENKLEIYEADFLKQDNTNQSFDTVVKPKIEEMPSW